MQHDKEEELLKLYFGSSETVIIIHCKEKDFIPKRLFTILKATCITSEVLTYQELESLIALGEY